MTAVTQAPVVIAGQDIERQIATATSTNCLTTQRRLLQRGGSEVGLRCILLASFEVSNRLRSVSDSAWIMHERPARTEDLMDTPTPDEKTPPLELAVATEPRKDSRIPLVLWRSAPNDLTLPSRG